MVLLCLSDIHGEGAGTADLVRATPGVDLVVLDGDLTHLGRARDAARVVDPIVAAGVPVVAVPGNMDRPDVAEFLDGRGILLHGRGRIVKGVGLFVLGGSNPTPFRTPFEVRDDEAARLLASGWEGVAGAPVRVLVSHAPPHGTRIDRTFGGVHAGSAAVRRFLEGHDVDLCVSGHIHEAGGEDVVARTRCINTGAWRNGSYVVVAIEAMGGASSQAPAGAAGGQAAAGAAGSHGAGGASSAGGHQAGAGVPRTSASITIDWRKR